MDPLIDRALLFGNPHRAQARISPNGQWLSWLQPNEDNVLNVFVAPLGALGEATQITNDTTRGIRAYGWAESGERLLFVQDEGGNEDWHVYSVDPGTREVVDLTPYEGVAAMMIGSSHKRPHHILLGVNDRNPALHDPMLVDVRTGESERLVENPGFVGWVVDHDLAIRAVAAMQPDGSLAMLKWVDGEAVPWEVIPPEDALTTRVIGYSTDGEQLYWLDSRGRDTAALVARSADGSESVLASDPDADIADVGVDPITQRPQYATSTYDVDRVHVIDPSIADDLARLEPLGPYQVVSRDAADQLWVVAVLPDDGPTDYHLYDRGSKALTKLFSSRDELHELPLARRRPVVITARDGRKLVSYLSLPRWLDQEGRPAEPLPMVLQVHGGPWARDEPGFDPVHQVHANRGQAVLSVNFRGSTGFGKSFINAGDKEWAAAMHDDLLDAVQWAIDEGIAKPDAIAIKGGSYGGYATLVGLTFTPEVFAAGVDVVGPSSLLTLLETIPPYWAPMKAQFHNRVGNDETEEGRALLWERSPLRLVEEICKPLLIAQGANDPRVKQSEADQIVAAMQERGIPVTYALFPDEGHGFARPPNRMAFMAACEGFLADHIGGRAQPIGADQEGTSLVLS